MGVKRTNRWLIQSNPCPLCKTPHGDQGALYTDESGYFIRCPSAGGLRYYLTRANLIESGVKFYTHTNHIEVTSAFLTLLPTQN